MTPMSAGAGTDGQVAFLDDVDDGAVRESLSACCASTRWVEGMLAARPFLDLDDAYRHSDQVLAELDWSDVREALDAHPRIGQRVGGAHREAGWSRSEQSGAADASADVAEQLRAGNIEYEARFGFVFLICATGLSADQMIAALRHRLCNDPATERDVVREELRRIVRLRLEKLAR
jgi:2-oxo-4-hydroxy-4-carboxy-5-ureidoimidazoline decarboxylase